MEDREPNDVLSLSERVPIAPKWELQRAAKWLLPESKTLRGCCAWMLGELVEVHRSESRQTAAYRGLQTCKSVHSCPVCSARISAHRAAELTEAIEAHRAAGGTVLLLTFTASHTRDDRLRDLLTAQADAHKRFWRQRTVRAGLDELGYIGRVSGLEVTYGHETGWHPHRHVLIFVERDEYAEYVWTMLTDAWVKACSRSGLTASESRGLDVRGGESAGAYVAKLGLEVALAVGKRGRGVHRFGPWQLLDEARNDVSWAANAFRMYAHSMKGRRHLVWSRGLREHFGLVELTDAEVVESKADEDERLFAELTKACWRGVYRNELRGELLQLLGIGDVEEARTLLRVYGVDDRGLTSGYE